MHILVISEALVNSFLGDQIRSVSDETEATNLSLGVKSEKQVGLNLAQLANKRQNLSSTALRPLLFLLYINDALNIILRGTPFMFVGDSKIVQTFILMCQSNRSSPDRQFLRCSKTAAFGVGNRLYAFRFNE